MERSISHLLEMGLAFMLFVMALSTFVLMYDRTMTLVDVARESLVEEDQVTLYEGDVADSYASIEKIFMLLTSDDLGLEQLWLGDLAYRSALSSTRVYIDGVEYPAVNDYRGKESLRAALLALPSSEFEQHYTLDPSGNLAEIHYVGR